MNQLHVQNQIFMIMKKVLSLFGAALMFVGAQAQQVNAGAPACPNAQGKQMHMQMLKKAPAQGMHQDPMACLKLTDDQKTQMQAIRLESQKKSTPLKAQLGIKRAELKALQVAEKTDTKAVNAKIDEIAKVQAELMKLAVDGKMKTRALLNDEQKVKFDAMGEGMHRRHEGCTSGKGPKGPQAGACSGMCKK